MNNYVFIFWSKYTVGTITPVTPGKSVLLETRHQDTHSACSARHKNVKAQDSCSMKLHLSNTGESCTVSHHTCKFSQKFHNDTTQFLRYIRSYMDRLICSKALNGEIHSGVKGSEEILIYRNLYQLSSLCQLVSGVSENTNTNTKIQIESTFIWKNKGANI